MSAARYVRVAERQVITVEPGREAVVYLLPSGAVAITNAPTATRALYIRVGKRCFTVSYRPIANYGVKK